jgi:hypothetical protein
MFGVLYEVNKGAPCVETTSVCPGPDISDQIVRWIFMKIRMKRLFF